jgi:hypothetical protein
MGAVEARVTAALETFVWHAEYSEPSRLNVATGIQLARAVSMDHHQNTMWGPIDKLNVAESGQLNGARDAGGICHVERQDAKTLGGWQEVWAAVRRKPDEAPVIRTLFMVTPAASRRP